ncbi:MAG: HPF/RaiA family ribosome-associated protein [Burkholderiales bacterium]|nr:HPF/RaiA family ribosome-associated protein [Burkholderiales bacterium]
MEHPLQINYEHVVETPALNRQIGDRVAVLERLLEQITSCHVKISLPHHLRHVGDLYTVQCYVTIPGMANLSTRSEGEELHTTIDAAFQAMQHKVEALRPQKRSGKAPHAGVAHGSIMRLVKGLGVIEDDDGNEYLFSSQDMEGMDPRHVGAGTEVQFLAIDTPSGWRAQRVGLARHHFDAG